MFSRLALRFLFAAMVAATVAMEDHDGGDHDDCTKGVPSPDGFNGDEWPTIYRMTSANPEDPMQENFDESATVDPSVLADAGVRYEFIDPTGFDYPNATAEIPWSPPVGGNNDAYVQQLRIDNDYQYADIIVVGAFVPKFWVEHSHAAKTIRYIIDGTGYFDLRDVNDEWVRIPVSAGDWFEWPAGINHRFSVDDEASLQAMRLYKGTTSPEWTNSPRSEVAGNNTARSNYVDTYLCGADPDVPVHQSDVMTDSHSEDSGSSEEQEHKDDGHSHASAPSSDDEASASSSAAHIGAGLVVGAAALVSPIYLLLS